VIYHPSTEDLAWLTAVTSTLCILCLLQYGTPVKPRSSTHHSSPYPRSDCLRTNIRFNSSAQEIRQLSPLPEFTNAVLERTSAVIIYRISCQRLRTLQQKQEAQAKATRREIATLLERGKIETAKIKVENSEHPQSYTYLCCDPSVSIEVTLDLLHRPFLSLSLPSILSTDPPMTQLLIRTYTKSCWSSLNFTASFC
jgi:hypothetical protein